MAFSRLCRRCTLRRSLNDVTMLGSEWGAGLPRLLPPHLDWLVAQGLSLSPSPFLPSSLPPLPPFPFLLPFASPRPPRLPSFAVEWDSQGGTRDRPSANPRDQNCPAACVATVQPLSPVQHTPPPPPRSAAWRPRREGTGRNDISLSLSLPFSLIS